MITIDEIPATPSAKHSEKNSRQIKKFNLEIVLVRETVSQSIEG